MPLLTSENTKILVCCHNPCELPFDDAGILLPIHSAKVAPEWDIQRDYEANGKPCENISDKDSSFCELTKWYWAWKNVKKVCPNIEYIGAYHYRRYFSFEKKNMWATEMVKPAKDVSKYRLNTEKLSKMLETHDVVLAKPFVLPVSMWAQYCIHHQSKDICIIKELVQKLYPDYKDDFDSVMWGNRFIGLNMFIMKWDAFVSYCEWLFGILFEAERLVKTDGYSPYQTRVISFLSERLLPVYVRHNFKKPKYLNVYFYSDKKHIYSKAQECRKVIKRSLSWVFFCLANLSIASFCKEFIERTIIRKYNERNLLAT